MSGDRREHQLQYSRREQRQAFGRFPREYPEPVHAPTAVNHFTIIRYTLRSPAEPDDSFLLDHRRVRREIAV